ncbi:MAG: AAA family ATPase [Cyanobacteria bacterium P01_A01_bin.68]
MAFIQGYHLDEELYNGLRTLVYRGIRKRDQKTVVIKLLKNLYPSFNELLQFRNQYTIVKDLDIPGIICAYSLEAYQNSYALVMEDFGGISLREYIQTTNTISTEDILAIALRITDILHNLHQNRVIHKDIKPANILINPQTCEIRLIDFSIASLLPKETQSIKNPNSLEGTLAYISPEQTGRMNRGIDYRSDFYSLGVTLFELITGELPFKSDDAMELVHCHIAKQLPGMTKPHPNPFLVSAREQEIPQVLSDIVMKLMAKNTEDRYQSALGLKYDLEVCLKQLQETGNIQNFEIARRDICDRFIIPEKLYGRETEVQELLAAFDRVTNNQTELILVAGFSGIGKTAIVNEVHKPIIRQRGYFIKGKFDQFNRNIPFSAFVQAFRNLMGQLLSETDTQLSSWKHKILQALGENGQVIIDVIPELEQIIGKQPPVAELSGTAAQNRFNLLFQKFIQVFTTKEHPLVIFLDDLQWADSASLKFMQLLMSESESNYLLVIGAYRDNEVFSAHPLMLTLEEISKAEAIINTITLAPLNEASLNQLVSDTLNCDLEISKPLTQLLYQKTKGNPFFSTQFFRYLYKDGLIKFDFDTSSWECDISAVKALATTSDVVEFMALQLQKLPEATQNVLKLAACIGNQFDLNILSIASEQSENDTANALWVALQEGLVLPTNEIYKFFQEQELNQVDCSFTLSVSYRFLHDRVQQAAYFLIPENFKQITRLKIGQLLLSNTPEEKLEENIFDIVNQLNYGVDLLTKDNQRNELARLNLIAGSKAKSSTAYNAAVDYLERALKLLCSDSWVNNYEISAVINTELLEAEYLNSKFEQANTRAEKIIPQLQSVIEKVKIYEIQIQFYIVQAHEIIAISKAITALEMLGINLPSERSEIIANTQELQQLLTEEIENVESLVDLPIMSDSSKLAAMRILTNVTPALLHADPILLPLVVFKMVKIIINFGNCPQAAFAYAWYGALSCGRYLNFDLGYQFGKLAVKVLNLVYTPELEVKVINLFNVFVRHWKEPLKATLNPLKDSVQGGIETGNIEFSFYNVLQYCSYLFFAGEPLEEVRHKQETYLAAMQEFKLELHSYIHKIWMQLIQNLHNKSDNYKEIVVYNSEQEDLLPIWKEKHNFQLCFYLYCSRTINLYFYGNYDEAIKAAVAGEEYAKSVTGMLYVVEHNFYYSLALLALATGDNYIQKIEINQEKLRLWASHAPMNFQHKFNLVEAEKYRILDEKIKAIELYDKAISGAKENEYVQEEALANELAAKFYLGWGRETIAATYMQQAYYSYARWGAKAKTDDLEKRYPQLLQPILLQAAQALNFGESTANISIHSSRSTTSSSGTNINTFLDFASIIKTSQTLSRTIELNQLLTQFTQIILQNSGGDSTALILPNSNEEWYVEAIATAEETQLCYQALENNPHLPTSLIQYVKNTQEMVLVDDLNTDLPIIDKYLLEKQPKSILCLPLLNQGNLIGILYLQNKLTSGVFTNDRIVMLNLLCTQAAISLENARLYDNLEQKVQQRTKELSQTLEQLQATQNKLVESEKMAALGSLVAGVAHEINTPVGTSITVASNLAARTEDFVNNIAQGQLKRSLLNSYLKTAQDSSNLLVKNLNRAGELVNSFKQVAVDQTNLELREFGIKEYIQEVLLSLGTELKQSPHEITVNGENPTIKTYAGSLAQVVTNLVMNSLIHAYPEQQGGQLNF